MRNLLAFVISAAAAAQGLWVPVSPPTHPSARYDHAMVFDAVNQRALVYGGAAYNQLTNSEIWAWQGGSWQLLGTGPFNASRSRAAVCTFGGGLLVHGGATFFVHTPILLGDTWLWQAGTWSQAAPSTVGPYVREYSSMVETPQGALLFGGLVTIVGPPQVFGDTWLWNGTAWSQLTPPTSPPARQRHQMVYDPSRGVVVLFGGVGTFPLPGYTDTWEWNGTTWTQRAPQHSPPFGGPMAWSPALNRTVLFTGTTWTWDGTDWQQLAVPPPAQPNWAMAYTPGGLVAFGGLGNQVALDTTTLFIDSPTATVTPFGAGCPGPGMPAPSLAAAPGTLPVLGTTLQYRVGNLPNGLSVPVLVLGLSTTTNTSPVYPLPIDLAFAGFPGCTQLVSIDSMTLALTLTPATDFPLAIPLQASLLGFTVHGQAVVLYVGGALAVSNGLTAVVGV